HVRASAALEALHRADLVALVMVLAVSRLDQLLEHVVEPFILEVAFLLCHPFLQPEVRLDDEFVLGHGGLLSVLSFSKAQQQSGCEPRCSATRRARIIFTWSSISRRAPAASRISISAVSSLCTSRIRRATRGVRVGLRAGHETCCSEMSCTTSTRLCDASATAR